MKKWLALVLCIALFLTFCACGKDKTAQEDEKNAGNESTLNIGQMPAGFENSFLYAEEVVVVFVHE